MHNFAGSGMKANNVDIAPKCSGMVCGYTNTIANICGFAAPQAVSILLASGVSSYRKQQGIKKCRLTYARSTMIFKCIFTQKINSFSEVS